MDDESMMAMAAYLVNERRIQDDPWHELATGSLTSAQVIAMRRDVDSPEQLENMVAAFGPSTEKAKDRRLEFLLRQYGSERSESSDTTQEHGARIVSMNARRSEHRWTSRTAIAGIMALAAALLLAWVLRPSSPYEGQPTLPGFELKFQGGWSGDMRSAGDAPGPERCDEHYRPEQVLSVRLAPMDAFGEPTSVAALARSPAGEVRWLEPTAKLQSNGVISIQHAIAEFGLEPGTWVLSFYVSRRGQQHDLTALQELEPGMHPGVTVVEGSICILE